MKTFISLVLVVAIPTVASANGDLTAYAFGDCFVYDRLLEDGRVMYIVLLLDDRPLEVVGKTAVEPMKSFSHCGQYLIANMHRKFAVYDLSDPAKPKLVETLHRAEKVREYCSDQKEQDTDLTNLEKWAGFGLAASAGKPFLLKETELYRYEVEWETEAAPTGGGSHHQMFLNKIRKHGEVYVSRLWLGLEVETVCSE